MTSRVKGVARGVAWLTCVALAMTDYRGAASEGNRAAILVKKREKQREELEKLKKKIQEVRSIVEVE